MGPFDSRDHHIRKVSHIYLDLNVKLFYSNHHPQFIHLQMAARICKWIMSELQMKWKTTKINFFPFFLFYLFITSVEEFLQPWYSYTQLKQADRGEKFRYSDSKQLRVFPVGYCYLAHSMSACLCVMMTNRFHHRGKIGCSHVSAKTWLHAGTDSVIDVSHVLYSQVSRI